MIEQFRKVEPLRLHAYSDDNHAVLAAMNQGGPFWLWVNMENEGWTVPEARALRDWLNRALPEDVCAVRTDAGGNIEPGTCTCGVHK